MQMERTILHSDLNSFYASVETMLNPKLQGRALAVCGATEDRHGIVLAKSEKAKKAGIQTGMVNWEAKQKCPELLLIPPQYDQYLKYSKLTRQIYERFTDKVESYGMDECWLDLSSAHSSTATALSTAKQIRQTITRELGLTVSIGVSFNKIFAKLGSDLKKPDAITVIGRDDFREKVWPLPVRKLLFIGRATERKLIRFGIENIGKLAGTSPDFLRKIFGKNGEMFWRFANGVDHSRVMNTDFSFPIKSIGRGTTCTADLEIEDDVRKIILYLSQDIGQRLRTHEMRAQGVQISIKDNNLLSRQYQTQLSLATQSPGDIAQMASKLFVNNYKWQAPVRAISVRAINLQPKNLPMQLILFDETVRRIKQESLEDTIETLQRRFGKNSLIPASLLDNLKIPGDGNHKVIMPGTMYV